MLAAADTVAVGAGAVAGGLDALPTTAFAGVALPLLWMRTVPLRPEVGRALPGITGRIAVAAVAAAALTPSDTVAAAPARRAVAAILVAALARTLACAAVRRLRRAGRLLEPAVIAGSGGVALRVADALALDPSYGLRPVGFVAESDHGDHIGSTVLGAPGDLPTILRPLGPATLVVAGGRISERALEDAIRTCRHLPLEVYLVSHLPDVPLPVDGRCVEEVRGMPLLRLGRPACRGARRKRTFDVVATAVLLIATAPVLALCAAAVRLSSPGPVLFRQRRVGKDGRVFELLKFRSMAVNDDSDRTWSVAGDERCTPVGRLLRSTSLDELPQLVNVLRGDMSLVGPRPERPYFVEQFSTEVPGYWHRHRVLPGMTGEAQVNGLRGDTSISERARFDNRYIECWSLWRDLGILLRTIRVVLGRQVR